MEYISDVILEDEFKNWEPGQRVFITASTGTGKSYFVFYKLLIDRVIEKGEKVLYLVNRKILKEQLKKEISSYVLNEAYKKYNSPIIMENFIEIETYQNIEQRIKKLFHIIQVN